MPPITTLEGLLAAIRTGTYTDQQMTELPTFGGEAPSRTESVWSWDTTRLLVGTCVADMQIIPRDE